MSPYPQSKHHSYQLQIMYRITRSRVTNFFLFFLHETSQFIIFCLEVLQSGCPENGQNLVDEVQIQRLKFNSILLTDESSIDKENSIRGRKVQNQMFRDSNKFY